MDSAGRVELLGLGFDPVGMEAVVERCLSWCDGPRIPRTVITANAAILCMMRRDEELRRACAAGDLIVADGMSVVWALRAKGTPVPERVAGVDLMDRLLRRGAEQKRSVFFLGAREEVVRRLVELCAERYPGLSVAGYRNGYFRPEQHEEIADQIREARPDMLFVGMPSPFKETWCERFRERLGVPVIMGVGGSFDVHAGYVKRAPAFLQAIGMEWSWRLLMEPRRMWKRYLTTNTEFVLVAGREILARRLGSSGDDAGAAPSGSL